MSYLELKKANNTIKQADDIFLPIDETVTQYIENVIMKNSDKLFESTEKAGEIESSSKNSSFH